MQTARKTATPLALAALGLAAALPHAARAQVQDPGFENATAGTRTTGPIGDGWTVTTGAIFINAQPHTGQQDADLDLGFDPNGLSQTLTTTAGQSYDISYWLADDVGGNALTVTFGGTTLFTGTTVSTGGLNPGNYRQFSYTAVASGPTTALTFLGQYKNGGDGVGTNLDDVSVTPHAASTVPEPSSVAAFAFTGLGAAALMLRARRRTASAAA